MTRTHSSTEPTVLRLYESVRTAHVELLAAMVPGVLLYRETMYDWHIGAVPPVPVHQASRLGVVRAILRTRARFVEINEPLMIRAWPSLLCQAGALWVARRVLRRPITVTTYAIENNPPIPAVASVTRLPERVVAWPTTAVVRLLCRSVDRMAFGTPDAEANYRRIAGASLPRHVTSVLELPMRCATCALTKEDVVLALGEFSERKGTPRVMAMWEALPPRHGLHLTMIGTGPLTDVVLDWAADRRDVRVLVDPPRAAIHAELARASTLVLLSRSSARWREQIGLPLMEGLAHGCDVVTTSDTGYAEWLVAHGHQVVDGDAPRVVADAVARPTGSAERVDAVLHSLPHADSRVTIDRWLHST